MKLSACLAATALACAALPATAAIYTTTLSGANEIPANASTASGTGWLELASDGNSIHVMLSWTGLTNNAGAGHVHCCSGPAANAPVAIGFSPSPTTSGSLDAFYNLTLLSTYGGGFQSGQPVAVKRAAFLAGLAAGQTYFNIHDAPSFGGGEIRGQLALASVPEPAAWALMIGGFGLVGGALRQRRAVAA